MATDNGSKIKELEQDLVSQQKEIEKIDNKLETLDRERREVEQELRKIISQLSSRKFGSRSDLERLEKQKISAEQNLEKTKQELFQAKSAHGGAYQAQSMDEADILSLRKDIQSLQSKIQMQLNKAKQVTSEDKKKMADVEAIIEQLDKLIRDLRGEKMRLFSVVRSEKAKMRAKKSEEERAKGGRPSYSSRYNDSANTPKGREAEGDIVHIDRDIAGVQYEFSKIKRLFEDLNENLRKS